MTLWQMYRSPPKNVNGLFRSSVSVFYKLSVHKVSQWSTVTALLGLLPVCHRAFMVSISHTPKQRLRDVCAAHITVS